MNLNLDILARIFSANDLASTRKQNKKKLITWTITLQLGSFRIRSFNLADEKFAGLRDLQTRRERLKSALYLRLKKLRVF